MVGPKEKLMNKIRWIYRIEQILQFAVLIASGYLAWGLRPGGVMFAETVYICAGVIFLSSVAGVICRVLPVILSRRSAKL